MNKTLSDIRLETQFTEKTIGGRLGHRVSVCTVESTDNYVTKVKG